MTQNIEEQKSQHFWAQQKTYKRRKKLLMCIFRKFPSCPTEETESLGGGGLRGVKGGGGGVGLRKNPFHGPGREVHCFKVWWQSS